MAVWLANRETSARPQPFPTLASRAKVTSSAEGRESRAVHDQDEPRSSKDASSGFFHWWPKKGTTEWIQYDLEKPATSPRSRSTGSTTRGPARSALPASWRILYREGDDWKPVETATPTPSPWTASTASTFAPVTTGALRLEVSLQPQWSAGIQEWKVE